MRTSMILAICLSLLALPQITAAQEEAAAPTPAPAVSKSLGHKLVFYLPNRAFDVFDFVRARLRVGPGLAVGARATRALEVGAGAHASVWGGIRGPRGEPRIPWPIGADARAGVKVGVGPDAGGAYYGATEVGFGFQAVIIGLTFGVDPLEVVDLLGGFVLWDPIGDDY